MKTQNNDQQRLVPTGELIDFEPSWFARALAQTPQDNLLDFHGSKLHYRKWDGPHQQAATVVLLHGDGAHARWFDFIAPLLTSHYRVMALDLPGMGDGGWLPKYSREIIAEAVITMIRHAELPSKPALVAHSFGGLIGLITAHHYPAEIAALMICDFHVKPPHVHEEWFADVSEPRKIRTYPTREEAEARFRLAPDQPCANQFILDYIASHSVRQVTQGEICPLRGRATSTGYTWKFDPSLYVGLRLGDDLREIYQTLPVPLAAMFGGLANDHANATRNEVIDFMRHLRPDAPHFDIPHAHHHIMLDRPHGFAAAIMTQMENWRVHTQ